MPKPCAAPNDTLSSGVSAVHGAGLYHNLFLRIRSEIIYFNVKCLLPQIYTSGFYSRIPSEVIILELMSLCNTLISSSTRGYPASPCSAFFVSGAITQHCSELAVLKNYLSLVLCYMISCQFI